MKAPLIIAATIILLICSILESKAQGKGEIITTSALTEPPTGWRGPNRDGIYHEKNLLDSWPAGGPELVWRYDSLGSGFSSAAVTSDRIFTVGTIDSTSFVFSFNHNGSLLWRKPLGKDWMVSFPGIRSTPTIYDGYGYVINGYGVLYCFDANDGKIIWEKDLLTEYRGKNKNWGFADNLIIDGDRLYCTPGGEDQNVVALNRKTGELIWQSKGNGEGSSYCTPVLIERGGRKLFINQPGRAYIAIDAENGELGWKYEKQEVSESSHRTPIHRDGYLLGLDDESTGCVMLKIADNGLSSEVVWRNADLYCVHSEGVLLGDRLYGPGLKNRIYCTDWKSGKTLFSQPFGNGIFVLISADNLIYSYDWQGNFSLLKPTETSIDVVGSFKVRGGTKEHFAQPVIHDGKLYIRHDNSLFVYNLKDESNL